MATSSHQSWSTSDVEPGRAFAYWTDTIFRSLLEIDSPSRAHFHAHMDQRDFGPATLFRTHVDIQTARRTRSRIGKQGVPGYVLVHMCAGELGLSQRDRVTRLLPGDTALVDMSTPYVLECLTETRSLMLHFQRDWLRTWLPSPEAIAAVPFHALPGWSGVLSASLSSLDATYDEPLALPAGVVAEQLAAMLALAAGSDAQATSPNHKLFKRLQRTIRERCHEPDLDIAAVANVHRISSRYLQHVLFHESTTFTAELMGARMAQAQRLLGDARYGSLSIAEVSARCGFLEPTNFARRVRRTFGKTPRELRGKD
jgi:AraC-like DNA-binding protein